MRYDLGHFAIRTIYSRYSKIPDGRQEVERKEVMVLVTDPKQVKERWSKLVNGGRVEKQGEDVAKEGAKGSLDPWQVDSAGQIVPFLHCLFIVPGFDSNTVRGYVA